MPDWDLPEVGDYMVTELCPHCEYEFTIRWSVEEFGYTAYCPVCGKLVLLCSECRKGRSLPCNYDAESDSCRFRSRKRRVKHPDQI